MFHMLLLPVLLLPLLPPSPAAPLHPSLLPRTSVSTPWVELPTPAFFISRRLAALGPRIDTFITTKFPRASQEEKEEVRRQLRRAVLDLLEDKLDGTGRMSRKREIGDIMVRML